MIPDFPVYLFDVDGTLVDSAEDICGAIRSVLAKTQRAEVEQAYLKRYIGHHLISLFTDLFPELPPDEIDALICDYRQAYPARDHASTRLYPGVKETLAALGGRKSTATTKGTPTTRIVLEKFGLLEHFDHVQGTDGFPSKPAPEVILRSIEALRARPEDCLLVGDSAPDMEAGRAAGVRTCAVRYGYGDLEAMARWKPDFWIDRFGELLPLSAGELRETKVELSDGAGRVTPALFEEAESFERERLRRGREVAPDGGGGRDFRNI